jgi:hypothetical protein
MAGVVDTDEQLIASVIDTSDKHSFVNISAKLKKKIETAWGTLIHEKNLKLKISCQTPIKFSTVKD